MNLLGKTHGKHCQLRAFRTVCPNPDCKKEVFYWECIHGCKVFFEYPIYGKLIRHKCKTIPAGGKLKKKYRIEVKVPTFIEKEFFGCPICGKIFKTKEQLNNHIIELKKTDKAHQNTLDEQINQKNGWERKELKEKNSLKSRYEPLFGKIRVINKKQK